MYLVAIMDWHSRRVLSWRVSNTLDTDFCVEALNEALQRFGAPQIFNTDQGSQFTSEAFTNVLKDHGIEISMDGKGRWVDNVFVERLWRSVKVEDLYLRAYETPDELRAGLDRYFRFYNTRRRHSALDRRTPDAVYFIQAGCELAARISPKISLVAVSSFRGPLLLSATVGDDFERVEGEVHELFVAAERAFSGEVLADLDVNVPALWIDGKLRHRALRSAMT